MKHLTLFLLIPILASVAVISCTDGPSARRTLDAYGFTDVQITGYTPFGCGEDDMSHTGFMAKSMAGRSVSGVVCCGALKACTVRF